MNLQVPKNGAIDIKTRQKLAAYASNLREEWKREKQGLKSVYDPRRKKHVKPDPKWGYIKRTVDENFPSLKNAARNVSLILSSVQNTF